MNAFKQSDSPPTLDTSSPSRSQQRIFQIEQKLAFISTHKQAQQQLQLQQSVSQRVLSLQSRSAEQARLMDSQLQQMQTQLSALVLEEKEMSSRRERGLKMRAAAIAELKGKLKLLTEDEMQEGRGESEAVMGEAELKVENLERQFESESEVRKHGMEKLEGKLTTGLSNLHQHIQTADSHAQHQLATLSTRTHSPLSTLTLEIHSSLTHQHSSHQSLLHLLSSTISSLQSDLQRERSARCTAHTRLTALLARLQ